MLIEDDYQCVQFAFSVVVTFDKKLVVSEFPARSENCVLPSFFLTDNCYVASTSSCLHYLLLRSRKGM